jgi:hypothetical protein
MDMPSMLRISSPSIDDPLLPPIRGYSAHMTLAAQDSSERTRLRNRKRNDAEGGPSFGVRGARHFFKEAPNREVLLRR